MSSNVKNLIMNSCGIGAECSVSFAGIFGSAEVVYLDDNPIGAGVNAWSQHSRVKVLSVVGCGIGNSEFEAFSGNNRLTRLDLSCNKITDAAVRKVSLPQLLHLVLNANRIKFDEPCIQALAENMPLLTGLEARDNRITSAAAKMMTQLCASGASSIKEFDLSIYASPIIPKTFLIQYPSRKRKLEEESPESTRISKLTISKKSL